jgi:hypothetical protein
MHLFHPDKLKRRANARPTRSGPVRQDKASKRNSILPTTTVRLHLPASGIDNFEGWPSVMVNLSPRYRP